jgi:hypoxanthine phosphoribosyltransferase
MVIYHFCTISHFFRELFSQGTVPYPDMDNAMTRTQVLQGYRLPKPEKCTEKVYNWMLYCWKENPEERPTFEILSKFTSQLVIEEIFV